jgi:hypothetical protein
VSECLVALLLRQASDTIRFATLVQPDRLKCHKNRWSANNLDRQLIRKYVELIFTLSSMKSEDNKFAIPMLG